MVSKAQERAMDVLLLSIRLVRVFQTLKVEPESAFISGHLV